MQKLLWSAVTRHRFGLTRDSAFTTLTRSSVTSRSHPKRRRVATLLIPILLLFILPLHAQDDIATLEGKLAQNVPTSEEGAKLLLELVDACHKEGRVFGLIRHARTFTRAQSAHPHHKTTMLQLLDGLLAASEQRDYIASARQFLEKYKDVPEGGNVARNLARIFEIQGAKREAADAFSEAWRLAKQSNDAVRAITLYAEINAPETVTAAATLARALFDSLPDGNPAALTGMVALERYRQLSQWTSVHDLANRILERNLILSKPQEQTLYASLGDALNSTEKPAEAVDAYRKALERGTNPDLHRNLSYALNAAKGNPDDLLKEAHDFAKLYPDRTDRWDPFISAIHAYQAAGNTNRAIELGAELMKNHAHRDALLLPWIEWRGKEPAQLQATAKAIESIIANAEPGPKRDLRYALAFDIYRDALKDPDKAYRAARFLFLSDALPDHDNYASAFDWLMKNAPDQAGFEDGVKKFLNLAGANPHLSKYRALLPRWIDGAKKEKEHRERAQWADARWTEFRDAPINQLAIQASGEPNDRTRNARESLLKESLNDEAEIALLKEHAYDLRQRLNEKDRNRAIPYYERLTKKLPKDSDAARQWLDAAIHYGQPDDAVRAAKHVLTLSQNENDHTTIRYLLHAAEKAEDKELARSTWNWLNEARKKFGPQIDSSREIGDQLSKLGLESEAIAFWRETIKAHPDRWESREIADRVRDRLKGDERATFTRSLFENLSDNHGAFTAMRASDLIAEGKIAEAAKVMSEARDIQDQRLFTGWGLGEYPPQSWIDSVRADEKIAHADKALLFKTIDSLHLGRASSAARLSLFELGQDYQPVDAIERLIAWADAALSAEPDAYTWNRLWPYAQAADSRKDHAACASLTAAMLANLRGIGENEKNAARALLRGSYAGMGAAGLEVNPDSPVAPLLEIGLHLRLGDPDAALAAYHEHKELFDKHRLEIPVEILVFAALSHVDEGGEENLNRAEDMLRAWLIKFSEGQDTPPADKARIQLTLARVYDRAGRYEVARSEYGTVVNRYPDSTEAEEARFGIGETLMAQKIYDQAEEIFTDLSRSQNPKSRVRGEFLRGVLASERGDRDEARRIFRNVLSNNPDIALTDRTLFELSEVYGHEQRFLDQLELLRTVGRLSRQSKRWHAPGYALSIVVQDTDLGISRGHNRLPVIIRTDPGGDEETAMLSTGGAGKGLFIGGLPTSLGTPKSNDGILQVLGLDNITVDYPDDFKRDFRFEITSNNNIGIAADGSFDMASARIVKADDPTITDEINAEAESEKNDQRKSITRPSNQIKPGNPIYLRVDDADRSLTADIDHLNVRLTASNGDAVSATLTETAPASGTFLGEVVTGELPAGATASDTAIHSSPLMAIDNDPSTTWISEPDGVSPKFISADLKDLRQVSRVTVTSPDTDKNTPEAFRIEGSHDGRFFYALAAFPEHSAAPVPALTFEQPTLRIYQSGDGFGNWDEVVKLAAEGKPFIDQKEALPAWKPISKETEGASPDGPYAAVWTARYIQPRDGAARFSIDGTRVAAMIDGRLVLAPSEGPALIDVFLKAGIHRVLFFAKCQDSFSVQRARENPNRAAVTLLPFQESDFTTIDGLNDAPDAGPLPKASEAADGRFAFTWEPRPLRHIRVVIDAFKGEAVAVNHLEIGDAAQTWLPSEADLLALTKNETLEIAPGDSVTGLYVDEIADEGRLRNQPHTHTLTATYYNGEIRPVAFDFTRSSDGTISQTQKDLLRIDPGERITIQVTDYDLDSTGQADEITIEAFVGNESPLTLKALETGPTTGVFQAELNTAAPGGEPLKPAEGIAVLPVKPGDQITLRYSDEQNTFPGHTSPREGLVIVRTPSDGILRIVESRLQDETFTMIPDAKTDGEKGVSYVLPFTVEVIDPDAARDSRSSVMVQISVEGIADPLTLACQLSSAFSESDPPLADVDNPALMQGRFIGQVRMRLGGVGSPASLPMTADMSASVIGSVVTEEEEISNGRRDLLVPVLNVTGASIISATYTDAERPDGSPATHNDTARILDEGMLTITDAEYELEAEELTMGERIYLKVRDADLDVSDARDRAIVHLTTADGEDESFELEETLTHSGVFTGSLELMPNRKATPGNLDSIRPRVEGFFGGAIEAAYLDQRPASQSDPLVQKASIPIAVGANGSVTAFSKVFTDEELAIQTRFHIAESWFELFKNHRTLERSDEAKEDLANGRRTLRELSRDFPNPKYAPRIAYLLGQFSQELKDWEDAISSYQMIVRDYPAHALAADAQYKLGQCYEEADRLDDALESYVTMAATYPDNPLIANVMIRINDHFYQKEDYPVAAQVASKFLERFPNHQWSPKMAFRVGQCYYKAEEFKKGGEAFDSFVKKFPDDELSAQSLFWAGESFRMANNVPEAFRRYNRCRWDFPESDAAKYSRGRLALPEMLAQFEREANTVEEDQ